MLFTNELAVSDLVKSWVLAYVKLIKLQLVINSFRNLKRINLSGNIIQMASVSIKMIVSYQDSHPRLLYGEFDGFNILVGAEFLG